MATKWSKLYGEAHPAVILESTEFTEHATNSTLSRCTMIASIESYASTANACASRWHNLRVRRSTLALPTIQEAVWCRYDGQTSVCPQPRCGTSHAKCVCVQYSDWMSIAASDMLTICYQSERETR